MMKRAIYHVVGLLVVCLACSAYADEFKAKCPVSGAPAKKESAVDYKGGKVYFCCDGCPASFKKDTAKYAAKANQQLVVTGQAKQAKCPLTGGKCNPAAALEVGGVQACFCCDGCKGKVAKASAEDQVKMVFDDEAFAKGFKVESK
jgi:YHS domain-containing protein